MKIKTSEAFRIAQRIVLESHPIRNEEEIDTVLDVLSVLRKEEEMALMREAAVAEKEAYNETL